MGCRLKQRDFVLSGPFSANSGPVLCAVGRFDLPAFHLRFSPILKGFTRENKGKRPEKDHFSCHLIGLDFT